MDIPMCRTHNTDCVTQRSTQLKKQSPRRVDECREHQCSRAIKIINALMKSIISVGAEFE